MDAVYGAVETLDGEVVWMMGMQYLRWGLEMLFALGVHRA